MREVADLPERSGDTRVISNERQAQQNQSEPPEPEVTPGNPDESEPKEIPDEKVQAAKKRLGRSG